MNWTRCIQRLSYLARRPVGGFFQGETHRGIWVVEMIAWHPYHHYRPRAPQEPKRTHFLSCPVQTLSTTFGRFERFLEINLWGKFNPMREWRALYYVTTKYIGPSMLSSSSLLSSSSPPPHFPHWCVSSRARCNRRRVQSRGSKEQSVTSKK
jgi:hypothetical protein